MNPDRHVALVTGANKGLGFEIARQLGRKGAAVLLGARDAQKGEAAAAKLRAEGLDARFVPLSVTDAASVRALPDLLAERAGRLDILVNNAGVLTDSGKQPSTIDLAEVRTIFDTNVWGAWAVAQACLPLLRKSPAGRIVNMSSTLGSLAVTGDPDFAMAASTSPGYQMSKAALNMLTVLLAKELRGTKVKVNSACPGWVRTDMGGAGAPLAPEQGADTPVWLATLPDSGPTGGFFNSREPVAW